MFPFPDQHPDHLLAWLAVKARVPTHWVKVFALSPAKAPGQTVLAAHGRIFYGRHAAAMYRTADSLQT